MEWDDQDFKNENSKKKLLEPLNYSRNVGLQEKWTVQQGDWGGREGQLLALGHFLSTLLLVFGGSMMMNSYPGTRIHFILYWRPDSWASFREHLRVCLPGYRFWPADFLQVGGKSLEAMAYALPNPLPDHSQKFLPEAWIYYHKHVFY